MHETYLNNMKVKACMKIVDTKYDHLETLQNEKVKLGWGWHPQLTTIAIM